MDRPHLFDIIRLVKRVMYRVPGIVSRNGGCPFQTRNFRSEPPILSVPVSTRARFGSFIRLRLSTASYFAVRRCRFVGADVDFFLRSTNVTFLNYTTPIVGMSSTLELHSYFGVSPNYCF